ncbi:MAG: serine/threonine-protein kinase [Acidobacteria bacterium]|nr:serine/threonine-protein kinase [Acidobacteriota bacterium]MBI3486795.1 serine/threonine-protein kinase [Acidobacteriota bacterium]
MEIEPGSQLGAYTVLARIGSGGMGDVFKARDLRLGRLVAIKTLGSGRMEDAEARARFEREARLLADLSHPNLLAIYDVGHLEGHLYLVTEFLDGEPLSASMAQGPLAPERAIAIARHVALGLAAAHARGIVHRDLKPSNVMLLRTGLVKLLDFGLAKDLALEAWPNGQSLSGALVGTVGYLSPEQAAGEPVDGRSDLFNLGILLHEMVTGQAAFQRETAIESVHAALKEAPCGSLDQVPAPLRRLISRCLEKDPDLRFQSASDLAFALETLEQGPSVASPALKRPALPALGRPVLWAAAGLAAVGIAAAAVLWGRVGKAPARNLHGPVFRPITPSPVWVASARFSKDGRSLAYSMQGADWMQHICTFTEGDPAPQELPLIGKVVALGPGGELYFTDEEKAQYPGAASTGTLYRRKGRGEAPRPWLEEVQEADLNASGQQVALLRQVDRGDKILPSTVIEYPAGRTLATGHLGSGELRLSPDGKRIAYIRRGQVDDLPGEIVVMDLEGKERFVSRHLDSILTLAWAPDGGGLLYSWNPEPGTPFRISRLDLDGRETLLLSGPQSLLLMDVAPDGRLLVFASEWDVGGHRAYLERKGRLEPLDMGARVIDRGAISPDGTRLAYAVREADGRDAIYLRRTDGSAPTRLGAGGLALAISPDNAWVLVQRQHMRLDRGRPTQLVLIPTGPGREIPLRTEGLREVRQARFLPGHARVLVGTGPENAYRPLLVGTDQPPAYLPGVLPDERLFAVLGESGVAVQAFGKVPALLTPDGQRQEMSWLRPAHFPVGWDAQRQELILLEGPQTLSELNAWLRRREVRLWRTSIRDHRIRLDRALKGDMPFFATKLPYIDMSHGTFMMDSAFRGILYSVEGVQGLSAKE